MPEDGLDIGLNCGKEAPPKAMEDVRPKAGGEDVIFKKRKESCE